MHTFRKFHVVPMGNDNDAFIPELWSEYTVAILVEQMMASNMVHRDFATTFAKQGDVVNTRKPQEMVAKRKVKGDTLVSQDAAADNIQIHLDQHVYVSFEIDDADQDRSMVDLIPIYIEPAAIALARFVDQMVLFQYPQFLNNQYGTLGGLTNANGISLVSGVRGVLNGNKAPISNRHAFWGTDAETLLLQNEAFYSADKSGDMGVAMREANIGRKFGMGHWLSQNVPLLNSVTAEKTGAINLTAGYPKGYTGAMVVDGFTGLVVANQWCLIAGRPYQIASQTDDATNTTGITLVTPLVAAVADGAVITTYAQEAVDFAAGYSARYNKYISIDDGAGAKPTTIPQVGQFLTFGSDRTRYCIMEVDTTTSATEILLLLDRGLDAAVAENAVVSFGPPGGGYNSVIHPAAMALVIRALQPPIQGAGARSGLASYNNVPMRTTFSYDGDDQRTRVTLDFLAGIQTLDSDLGAVALS